MLIKNYHVTHFIARSEGGFIGLGGNQGDMVRLSYYRTSAIYNVRYPIGYTPNFDLPFIHKLGIRTGNSER